MSFFVGRILSVLKEGFNRYDIELLQAIARLVITVLDDKFWIFINTHL